MRAPAVSFVRKIAMAAAVGLLASGLALPHTPAFAEGEDAPSALLASSLMDGSASVVREDVVLAAPEGDAAPEFVIGSFTVDGLTFAVTEGSSVQLVGVSPSWQQATGLQAEKGSSQLVTLASEAEGSDAGSSTLLLPETVAYNGVDYSVTSIGAYAFYLSGVTSVELPAIVTDVDDRAFRSSDVTSVTVAEGNPSYSSFDGALYDAEQSSLLLIPEGKQGTVLLPKTAESAAPSVFSHCPLVTQISVEEGSAAFASENGLLYDASLTTLLRVPAGATDITIREGCTTIAAGALEACASLTTINAPATVTSISPYLLEQEPETVVAPVALAAVEEDAEADLADEGEPVDAGPQLSAMIALSSVNAELPNVNLETIELSLMDDSSRKVWEEVGFLIGISEVDDSDASGFQSDDAMLSSIASYNSQSRTVYSYPKVSFISSTGSVRRYVDDHPGVSTLFTASYGQAYHPVNTMSYIGLYLSSGKGYVRMHVGENLDGSISTLYRVGTAGSNNSEEVSGVESAVIQVINLDTWASVAGMTGEYGVDKGLPESILGQYGDGGKYLVTVFLNGAENRSITWNANEGTVEGHSSMTETYTVSDGSTVLPTPTRPGYVCTGWWTAPTGGQKLADAGAKKPIPASHEVDEVFGAVSTFYAQWERPTSTVSFDANDGKFGTATVSPSTVKAAYGSNMPTTSVPIPSVKPSATEDWEFAGYFDGTGKDAVQYYTPSGDSVASAHTWDKTASTVTLYAHWSRSIKLDFQGGSGGRHISSIATFYYKCGFKGDIGAKPIEPTDSTGASLGWDFLGYCGVQPSATMSSLPYQYFDSDCKPTGCATNPTGDTIYAWWVKEVTLHKYANAATSGNTGPLWVVKGGKIGYACTSSMSYNANVKEKFPATSPLKVTNWAPTWSSNTKGWAFDGYWSSGNDVSATQYIDKGGNGVIACPDKMPSILYAQWAREVTLVKQGGSGGSESGAQVYDDSQAVSYPYRAVDPPTIPPGGTSSGWEFLGYCNYDPSNSPVGSVRQLIKSDGSPTGRAYSSTTLYAWWVKEVTLNKGHDKAVWGTGAKKTINALLGAPLGYACTTTADTESEVRTKFPNPSGLGAEGWAPTRTGYVFGGYYDSSSGSTRYITASGGRGDAVPQGLGSTIYAKWYATLTLDANGGSARLFAANVVGDGKVINLDDYQNCSSITVHEVGSPQEPAIYKIGQSEQAGIIADGRILSAAFWNASASSNPSVMYAIWISRPGYVVAGLEGTNLKPGSGNVALSPGSAYKVLWEGQDITLTWDANGGSFSDGKTSLETVKTYSDDAKVSIPTVTPTKEGKNFAGWCVKRDGGEAVTASTSLPTESTTYYACWVDSKQVVVDANGGEIYLKEETASVFNPNRDNLINMSPYQGVSEFTMYEIGSGSEPAIFDPNAPTAAAFSYGGGLSVPWWSGTPGEGALNYFVRIQRTGYTAIGMTGTKPDLTTTTVGNVRFEAGSRLVAQWRPNRYTVAFDANGANGTMPEAMAVDYEQGAVLPEASAQGLAFRGWNTKADGTGDAYQPGDACDTLTQTDGATVTLYAQWTPIVSADAPIEVTAQVDLLGIEDQVPASGYIESRSGGALKVAAVECSPLAGAAELFGSRTADVALEALAGERATVADVSFSLDAKATEVGAAKLAAFALPDGFGTKMPIGYRFVIPEDVLASIDPARFEQVTTPVCSVVYTVALAS